MKRAVAKNRWDEDPEGEEDDGFEGVDEEDAEDQVFSLRSLFDPNGVLSSLNELIEYEKSKTGFDLRRAVAAVDGFDDPVRLIMLINFIRSEVNSFRANNESINIMTLDFNIDKKDFLSDERYLLPVLAEDQLLVVIQELCDIEDDDDDDQDAVKAVGVQHSQQASSSSSIVTVGGDNETDIAKEQEKIITDLRAKLARYEAMIANLASEDNEEADAAARRNNNASSSGSNGGDDSYYFEGYSHLSIHETMLRDAPRTSSYANAILANSEYLAGKVVLDVGCGTGILSLLAAKAGAKRVIGVDLSTITSKSKRIVEHNGYKDVITIVHGRLECVELPLADDEKVDVIISEWMGYALYFENMLSSVFFARDKYLAPNGILMPSSCSLFIEAFSCAAAEDDRVGWWKSVYGFDLTEVQNMLTSDAQVQFLNPEDIISNRQCFHDLDIKTAEDADLDFESEFDLRLTKETEVMGLVVSFDVDFENPHSSASTTVLSTAVQSPATHWKQAALWFTTQHRTLCESGVDTLIGTIRFQRSVSNKRDYILSVRWTEKNSTTGKVGTEKQQQFAVTA